MTRIDLVEVADLRAVSPIPYDVSRDVPGGAIGLFGPSRPLGSAEYAAIDARSISPKRKSPPDPIPGWRASGSLWPNERFIVRIPRRWNGKLVVAGTPAQRSEFANDILWSDPLLARGYAYVGGNKSLGEGGVLLTSSARLEIDGAVMPRFFAGDLCMSFWQHAPGNTFSRWMREFFEITTTAQELIARVHGRRPELTYAVGLSNGGMQVRYALERSDLYAGGISWNAPLWTADHNLLRNLPQAVAAMEAGTPDVLGDFGFPRDIHGLDGSSLYALNLAVYWAVTPWLYGMLFDPEASIPYGDVREPAAAESWGSRMASWRMERSSLIAQRINDFAHTGELRAKMIDLASEFDHLIPPQMHFHPYGQMVVAAGKRDRYRGEIIANAQHVDAWSEDPNYPDLRPGHPRVLAAFDELVRWVEG